MKNCIDQYYNIVFHIMEGDYVRIKGKLFRNNFNIRK